MTDTFSFDDFFRDVGVALHSTHNCLATDLVDKEPDEQHWLINNLKAINSLEKLELIVSSSKDICPLCGHCNIRL